ncbi:MAG: hypothetical protein M1834_005452 [Cirrosporium novae-zelandiae]|nr:MAG: hypothetical protein M1834_005452 [Cirrosporium novae-zelandiae]
MEAGSRYAKIWSVDKIRSSFNLQNIISEKLPRPTDKNRTAMPHKHRRNKRTKDKYSFELDPTVRAEALPTFKSKDTKNQNSKDKPLKRKRKNRGDEDDMPKEFKRLMQWQSGAQKRPSGLDDGNEPKNKKRKQGENTSDQAKSVDPTFETPKILPNERLRDFAARVDAALPIKGLVGGKKVPGLKEPQTRKEKKMHKMYDEWREVDRKIKAQKEEELEELEELEEEQMEKAGLTWEDIEASKNKKRIGKGNSKDEDPWAVLKERRKNKEPKSINDVAQAPPQFTKLPREVFKVRNGAKVQVGQVPKNVGSLKRREDLEAERKDVITAYRKMMEEKRNKTASL